MLYGIVYVYRLSDFMEIASAHGVSRIFLHSLWLRQNATAPEANRFKWTDLHELGFMGAFGMGYKMVVEGQSQECKSPDNHLLWTQSGLVTTHIEASCARVRKGGPDAKLIVTPGVLDCREVYRHVRIPWTLFMEDKVSRQVSVHDGTY